jgi:hypothetical protein
LRAWCPLRTWGFKSPLRHDIIGAKAQVTGGKGEGAERLGRPFVRSSGAGPNVHLDIQIHIPADASAEQIYQIFESMARHLYKQ